ncbi:MAG: FAD-dependent monooxygenase, partial [Clostridia bacterium]|nr:FAD-dependent monooxygenase [Clostridia bacterium]
KKSLDARDKENIKYIYSIEFSATAQPILQPEIERLPKSKLPTSPVLVVGGGPAGLFCALQLLKRGIAPILIERGAPVEERERTIQTFCETKKLDTETNVQFGEGGAGTFSDGKLNTQTHSPFNDEVWKTFVEFGAPEEILWLNKPHIGSDNLKTVVKNMRTYLLQNGAQVRFYTRLDDIVLQGTKLVGATLTNTRTGEQERLDVSALVLAVGHSARDTFEKLLSRGVCMRQKDFAVGVRIEHLQSAIGLAQYGKSYTKLPAADYKLVSHANERAVFTFCMCPGGYVMPAASEEGGVVTNGMSNFARNGLNANSALIAQVSRADFDDDSPLAGVRFQQKIERAAYTVGGGNYAAPVQRVEDFLRGKISQAFGEVLPTYGAGTTFADLHAVLPLGITQALKDSLLDMDKKLRGFAHPDALLTGAETRTSSPLRIERDKENLQSVSTANLYPCGEGAGYAGGITSSAADGIRVANAVYASFL